MKKPQSKINIISLHLGQGSSLCAIKNGISVDTSMGFTPLEGLMMTTRSGSISPSIIFFLQRSGWSLNDIESCFNRESGVLGVSGVSDEMKDVVDAMQEGNKKARLAIEMFVGRLLGYFGAYYIKLKKVDAIIAPTVPRLPHKIGSKITTEEMYFYDALTIPANFAEIAAISIPAGKIKEIPVGLQIIVPAFHEDRMFKIAEAFEK